MKNWIRFIAGLLAMRPARLIATDKPQTPDGKPLLDVVVRRLNDQQAVNLAQDYRDKVLLIVNTASQCAFTSQYEGLEQLYARYRARGLVVLGFPSNDFANQEPGDEADIQQFCRLTYGVKFPMFAKTRVRKGDADPLYQRLGEAAGEYPQWNFHKYLVDRQGRLVASFASGTRPGNKKLQDLIESLL
ncbi:MAG: glutathione peroxidase [Gammaproteobacteria bacterium]